jgi:hypothetical protein
MGEWNEFGAGRRVEFLIADCGLRINFGEPVFLKQSGKLPSVGRVIQIICFSKIRIINL